MEGSSLGVSVWHCLAGRPQISMTNRTRLVLLVVTVPILGYTLVGGLLGSVVAREGTYQHLRVFEDVVSLVTNNYVEPVETESIIRGALWGLAEGLDSESSYLTADETKIYTSGSTAGEVGIGLELRRQYYVQVLAARDGSPAAAAGLHAGDFLRAIDNNPTRMMSTVKAHQLLLGAPGSAVRLSVIRDNAADPIELEVIRGSDRSANVSGRVLSPGVGYLRITEFDDDTIRAIESTTDTLKQQGTERLLIDLRNTAVGSFRTGIAAAALFTDADTLVIRETSSVQEPFSGTSQPATIGWPVVLVTNQGTAGAAELFAAALADNDRAESVGLRTAGRAAEQTLVELPEGGGLLLSSTQYLTSSGASIHRAGVDPAVVVQGPLPTLGQNTSKSDEDPVLDRALEHLTAMPTI
ncbi:MAG TPA: hypothetical protein DIU48_04060 [Acidobacteria bacterium]|nr:hypothetical protein [Acidobacteriota bacterium]